MITSPLLLLLPLATLLLSQTLALLSPNCNISPSSSASTLEMMHANHPCSPLSSNQQPLSTRQMLSDDEARHEFLSKVDAPVASGLTLIQRPIYIVRARIGNPEREFFMVVDTSSDAAWVPCQGCVGCTSTTTFDPTASSTFMPVPCTAAQCGQVYGPRCGGAICHFNMSYGGSAIAATLVQDTLTLATDTIPNFFFGCILRTVDTGGTMPPQGLLGLGRGPLSLLSQARNQFQSTFSYCLPNFGSLNFTGTLKLGARNQPTNLQCTQLLRNPKRSSLYYVDLLSIMVDSRRLDIPYSAFAFDPNTGAGTIIDSGTTFTRLVRTAYAAVRDEVRRRMGGAVVRSMGGFDTCYGEPVVVRSITLMFDDMSMTLPQENFLIRGGSGDRLQCLAMAASPRNMNSVVNIIAAYQQQNHRILIDRPNSNLCAAPESCTYSDSD